MTRQSVTLTKQNDEWLKSQVEVSGEYANKSELINDLVRRARRAEFINKKLARAEERGFTNQSAEEILEEFKGYKSKNEQRL